MLLRDLTRKLSRALHPPKTTRLKAAIQAIQIRDSGHALLMRRSSDELVEWACGLLPQLCSKLEEYQARIQIYIDGPCAPLRGASAARR